MKGNEIISSCTLLRACVNQTYSHTSIEVSVIGILNDDEALATFPSILTMAPMVAGDPTTSPVKFTVTLLSWPKKSGSELLFKFCKI